MWEPFRQNLMAEHCFYVEQAHKRLLSQFDDMERESDKAAEEHLEKMSVHFNPDIHDDSDFFEASNNKGVEFYQLLSDMRDTTRLSVIAGMFHQWDKNLKDWIVHEMHHWHRGGYAVKSIWKADFSKLLDFLMAFGFDVKTFPFHGRLDAMRLVVNVFKHGNGQSFDELKESFPEFVSNPLAGNAGNRFSFQNLNHTEMNVSVAHLDQFSEAILDFWRDIPEEICLPEKVNFPKWFEKEFDKDKNKA